MSEFPKRGDVYLVELDPVRGQEMAKTRPAVVVSPDEMNRHFSTVIVAPLTSTERTYATRCKVTLKDRVSYAALDQIRTVTRQRLVKKSGSVAIDDALNILQAMFSL